MSLKKKATSGFLWNTVEKFSSQFLNLIIGISLARILTPEDYGLIGMLAIFTAIGSTFVDSGMSSGLIQKINKKQKDYSTVFIFNFSVACLLYIILFLLAPFVANFYGDQRLVDLLRFISLNIIIGSLVSVQRVKLNIDLNFKLLAKINVSVSLLAGLIAIILSLKNFGYWALAAQIVLAGIFNFIALLIFGKWKYSFIFSKQSFKELFSFGSKLLFSGLYGQVLRNLNLVFIGKYYRTEDLGFYTRAIHLTELVSGTVSSVIQQVTYPLLASLQQDKDRMILIFRKLVKMSSFIIFPSMFLLSVLAEPLILLLLTDKWAEVIPLLQWMAFGRIFYPISALNLNLLNANGRSDLFLKVDLFKLPLVILAMLITIPIGVKAIIIGHVITSFISFFINAYMPGKLFGYGIFKQIKDIRNIFLNSLIMAFLTYFTMQLFDNMLFKLIVGIFIASVSYIILSNLCKSKELEELTIIFKRVFNGI